MAELLFVDDARTKLHGTICKYRGEPVKVNAAEMRNTSLSITYLKDGKAEIVNYTSDDFDYSTPQVGWFTKGDISRYLCRIPGRYNNLGLLPANLDEAVSTESFYSVYMRDCILGNHISFDEARKRIWDDKIHAVPFHRHASIQKIDKYNASIRYINRNLGVITNSGNILMYDTQSKNNLDKILKKIGVRL